jgi:hypothetical protein
MVCMKIVTQTPDQLVITASGTRNLLIGLVIIGVLLLQWRLFPGGLATVVMAIGVGVAGLITLASLGSARVEADRATGQLSLSRRGLTGSSAENLPLTALAGADLTSRRSSGSSPVYRVELILTDGRRWPLTRSFSNAAGQTAVAETINRWLAAGG